MEKFDKKNKLGFIFERFNKKSNSSCQSARMNVLLLIIKSSIQHLMKNPKQTVTSREGAACRLSIKFNWCIALRDCFCERFTRYLPKCVCLACPGRQANYTYKIKPHGSVTGPSPDYCKDDVPADKWRVCEQQCHSIRQIAMYTSGGNTITMTMLTFHKPSTNISQTNQSCQQNDNHSRGSLYNAQLALSPSDTPDVSTRLDHDHDIQF